MGKNVILTSEGARQFSNALELLNTSIKEFNQIVDKLVPEELINQGLVTYLKEFCKIIETEAKLNISVNTINTLRAGEEIEISLFRCFRILILLILRYGQVSKLSLTLNSNANYINLGIKDDAVRNIFRQPGIMVMQEIEQVETILKSHNGTIYMNSDQTARHHIEIQIPV